MKQRRETIESLLKDLRKASKLVDGVANKSRSLEDCLDKSRFVRCVGETLVHIFDLEADLFDIVPELAHDFLKPSLAAVNLDCALERLLSQNSAIRESTIREFRSHMIDEVASQFAEACASGTEYDFAQTWWHEQKQPFVPVVRVYKHLRHDRRFVRYHSAKVLKERFSVELWNNERDDVSLEVADQWFSSWLMGQEV